MATGPNQGPLEVCRDGTGRRYAELRTKAAPVIVSVTFVGPKSAGIVDGENVAFAPATVIRFEKGRGPKHFSAKQTICDANSLGASSGPGFRGDYEATCPARIVNLEMQD